MSEQFRGEVNQAVQEVKYSSVEQAKADISKLREDRKALEHLNETV